LKVQSEEKDYRGGAAEVTEDMVPRTIGETMRQMILGVAGILLVWSAIHAAETGRPKIYGIAYVEFKVTDLEKAKAFYGGELGLASGGVRNGNFVQASYVVNQDQRVELAKTAPGTGGSYLVEIALATDDLMGMRTYLTAKGVTANQIMAWPDGTKYFETQDPEGNKIVFLEQKRSGTETGAAGAISHKLNHAGIIVKDAQVEDRFYKDVLGFHVYWHGGMKDGETNWMAMQVPDGTDWIEYMLRIPADADKHTRGVMYHISLGVPSVKAAAERLEKAGVVLNAEEQPKIGKDGKWQLNLYDPDETRVELMEFTPVEKPCCSEYTGTHPKP
jgi:catechol 2,3-dioxygenase-like lactoylglutathione lyase family enzyme